MTKSKNQEVVNFNLNEAKIDSINVESFFNDYLKLYSAHSNVRGIPFIGDGLKEAQRKALWGMLARGDNASFDTVERLSSGCASETNYHHGIGSMQGTLVKLAQDFSGSNNLNLLIPNGQFGSRLSHTASASRYIETKLHENFRKIFKKEDDIILEQRIEGKLKIEPKYFIPLLPMALINGAEGMGTGHSTHIFCYSPIQIKEQILNILNGKKLNDFDLLPEWNGFKGSISRDKTTGQVIITGVYKFENSSTLKISELPVGIQSDDYEKVLFKLEDKKPKKPTDDPAPVKSFQNASDDTGFEFIVNVPRYLSYLEDEEIKKLFKLEIKDTENFTLWDTNGVLTKFRSPEHIIENFVEWRLEQYEDRRIKLINITKDEIFWLEELIRFIEYYHANSNKFKNTGKTDLLNLLEREKFDNGDKLLAMPIWSLTKDKIDEVNKKLEKNKDQLKNLELDNAKKMYERELKDLKLNF